MDNPRKVELRAQISPRICEKISDYFLTFIRGLLSIVSKKKRDQKISSWTIHTFKLGLVAQSYNTATGGQERDATGFHGLKYSLLPMVK
jgi:hypothetical protein